MVGTVWWVGLVAFFVLFVLGEWQASAMAALVHFIARAIGSFDPNEIRIVRNPGDGGDDDIGSGVRDPRRPPPEGQAGSATASLPH